MLKRQLLPMTVSLKTEDCGLPGGYDEHGYRDDEVEVLWSKDFACDGGDERVC
jgi:hypothetical protein